MNSISASFKGLGFETKGTLKEKELELELERNFNGQKLSSKFAKSLLGSYWKQIRAV